jgi:hypothetical protein
MNRTHSTAVLFDAGTYKGAVLSDCGTYRYELSRIWNRDVRPALFVGMNPSTADADQDDPTIRRCVRFARDLGYGGLLMGNLFAYRSTDPKLLPSFHSKPLVSPIGELGEWERGVRRDINLDHLKAMAGRAAITIAAWGAIKMPYGWENQPEYVRGALGAMHALAFTKDGHPRHPLYVKADVCPVPIPTIQRRAA